MAELKNPFHERIAALIALGKPYGPIAEDLDRTQESIRRTVSANPQIKERAREISAGITKTLVDEEIITQRYLLLKLRAQIDECSEVQELVDKCGNTVRQHHAIALNRAIELGGRAIGHAIGFSNVQINHTSSTDIYAGCKTPEDWWTRTQELANKVRHDLPELGPWNRGAEGDRPVHARARDIEAVAVPAVSEAT